MDYQRKPQTRQRWIRRLLLLSAAVVVVVGTTAALSRLEPAVPVVERGSVMIDSVRRDTMLRQVRGMGSLVPIDPQWVTAQVSGQVVATPVEPGLPVSADTVLLQMDEPQVRRAVVEARRALRSAEAELERFTVELEQRTLDLKAQTAAARASYDDAKSQAEMDVELYRKGLISGRQKDLSVARSERNQLLLEIQLARVENSQTTQQIQVNEKGLAVERARDQLAERLEAEDHLTIRAGIDGMLQQLGTSATSRFEVGQRVSVGTPIAKITDPQRLQAVLQVMETQARDVVVGQHVTIDTRNAEITGIVDRIDPAVESGTVTVDVRLTGELPAGARPDLTVDGIIEIERLDDALHVGKPSYTQAHSSIKLFKLSDDGEMAVSTLVQLGRSSVNTVEIVGGLAEGDQVILSDMRIPDDVDRIRLR